MKAIPNIPMDKYERELYERYDFEVTTLPDGHYVVTDPQMPKRKNQYIGGNLHALMLRAIDERNIAKAKFEAKLPSAIVIELPERSHLLHGKTYTLKKMIFQNPDATISSLQNDLKAKDIEMSASTISSIRSEFLSAMRVLRELGALRE